MPVNHQDFGRRIREARKAKGMTQDELADKIGVSGSFLGHIERGTRVASLDTLVDLCNVLEISPSLLLGASLDALATEVSLGDDLVNSRVFLLDFLQMAQQATKHLNASDKKAIVKVSTDNEASAIENENESK